MTAIEHPQKLEQSPTWLVSPNLGISVTSNALELVVALTGELDVATAPHLRRTLQATGDLDPASVVVDCGKLEFIDASGIGCLVGARNRMRARGCRLVVRRPSAMLEKMLDITGLSDLIEGN